MQTAKVNGVELCLERSGDSRAEQILLINGLGGQLTDWDDDLVAMFVAEGFGVILFDNRDTGLSTEMVGGPPVDVAAGLAGDHNAAYTLDDMADDAAALLAELGVDRAHVVGVSMGGMIAQTLAIRHPERVASLASIMSTTGSTDVGMPSEEAMAVLLTPAPTERAAYLANKVEVERVIGSKGAHGMVPDLERNAARGERGYDRSFRPAGVGRQLMAIIASGDRTAALGALRMPTVVIHGDADVLVRPSGGQATAAAIPGAEHIVMPGMGHDLPPAAWATVVGAVVGNARRAAP